ncbi:MAG TPA: HlyD family efflux transporter periplasmic adaptor subunit [Pedomonas sp.]|uniref:efflux RND transporter periplasmic adaptor subunit n=1 Tax=Pedomonas sp. TaxID=2976421 RepID=UPI002F41B4B5
MTGATAKAPPSPISILLGLAERARRASSTTELAFIMVNETRGLLFYRQAALWLKDGGVKALSGVSEVDRSAPFLLWLEWAFRQIGPSTDAPRMANADALPDADRSGWQEWLPPHALWVQLAAPDGTRYGTLMLARDEAWTEAEALLLNQLAGTYGLAWGWLTKPQRRSWKEKLQQVPRWKWLLASGVALFLLLPVRLSVLAPAEIVARTPAVVRSPIEGVVEKVHVEPNQPVRKGQPLFSFDATTLRGRLDVAQRALQTETADYERTAQQAFTDPKASAQLGVILGRIEERRAEVAQLDALLARSQVFAPRSGVAVLDSPSEWAGRPVVVGEKVLSVADERDTEIEAWLPPGDVIDLPKGAPVTVFLNVDPLNAVSAQLRYVAYEASLRPDGSYAHRVRAVIQKGEVDAALRLGLKGTARLDGKRVPLIYWLLRRPMTVVRQTLGW